MSAALEELEKTAAELLQLDRLTLLLEWDQGVNMPPGGEQDRALQVEMLTSLRHRRLTDRRTGEVIDSAWQESLDPDQRAGVRELKREYERATKLSSELVQALARASVEGYSAWSVARPANDFSALQPALERMISLKREAAEQLGYSREPYDALFDEYEPGATVAEFEPMLTNLASELSPLLDAVLAKQHHAPTLPDGPYPSEVQLVHCKEVAGRLGYDFERGRIDLTAHPFETGLGCGDVRIATRLMDQNFTSGLLATVHETGHGLYDQGLPQQLANNFAGQAISLGLHESQSRFWENHVGRSLPFWESEMPRLQSFYPGLSGFHAPAMLAAVNHVSRSPIRIEADELTYLLHIAVRFEIELALMRGSLEVGELPAAFNQAMERHLGITPTDDRDGVMQDVHWAAGLIGYFPTYALGSVYAAALFASAQEDLGGAETVAAAVRAGDHSGLLGWLQRNVHSRASLVPVREVIHDATGMPVEGPVDTTPFVAHLRDRYLGSPTSPG